MKTVAVLLGVVLILFAALSLRRRRRVASRKDYWMLQAEQAMERADELLRKDAFEESFALSMFAGMCVDKAHEAERTPFWKNAQ